jgi:hypothetical protein
MCEFQRQIETYSVDFNDSHFVAINPKEERGKSGCVYNSKPVRFSWLERKR